MSAPRATTRASCPPLPWVAFLVCVTSWSARGETDGPGPRDPSLHDPALVGTVAPAGGALPPRSASPRHFEDATGDLPNEPITVVAVDPDDAEVLYAGLDGFLFKSDDGGDTWRPVLSFPRGTAIDATDFENTDTGAGSADAADRPSAGVSFRGGAEDDGFGDALDGRDDGRDDDGFDDEDEEGDEEGEEGDLPDGSLDADDDADLDDVDSVDGYSADDVLGLVAFARAGPGVRALTFVPTSRGVFYVATPRGLFRTTTGGVSFERLQIPGGARENDVRDVAVDPARPSRLYVATAAGLMVTPDGGTTFAPAAGNAGYSAGLCVAAERMASGVLVLVGTERGLFRSTDGGDTFLEVLLRGLPPFSAVAAVSISRDNGTYYAGTARGLFVGERGASLLERYGGIPDVLVQAVSPDPFRLRAVAVGTRTRGVLFSPDAGLTLDEGAEQVPAGEVLAFARGAKPDDLLVATDRGVFRSVAGTGVRMSAKALQKLREIWRREPSLDDIAAEALAWNRLEVDVMGGMSLRAGLARWLPQLRARYNAGTARIQRDIFILRAGDQLPPGLDPDNDDSDLFGDFGAFLVQAPQAPIAHTLWVELAWDLDKIILSDGEVAALRQGPRWWAAERRVLDRVQSVWAARRRLMTEMALGDGARGRSAARDDVYRQLRIEELTAQLDAATGGVFSERAGSTSSSSTSSQDVQEAGR